ncbi:MAG TPA: hypothetical protein VFU37_00980 [Pyrinomonadaceae bacterium]|nr:hypothetical protein [Pyrinomonadaceae bacterium]
MLLSEKVRVEIFIPDLPDPSYSSLLTELETELSYTFGGCTLLSASGNFRSQSGLILPDKVNILFTDVALELERDRLRIGQYVDHVRGAIHEALVREESILISIHPIYHVE